MNYKTLKYKDTAKKLYDETLYMEKEEQAINHIAMVLEIVYQYGILEALPEKDDELPKTS